MTIATNTSASSCSGCALAQHNAARLDVQVTCGLCGSAWVPEVVAAPPSGDCSGCVEARAYLERIRHTQTNRDDIPGDQFPIGIFPTSRSGSDVTVPRGERVRLPRCRNGWTVCEVCEQIVALDDRGREAALDVTKRRGEEAAVRLARKQMLDDFANLARWRPYLEGKGTEPSPIVGDGNRGGGAKLSATDRPDYVNEAGAALQRAMDTAQRLEDLLSAARVESHKRSVQRTSVGSRLRRIREQLGLSRDEFAEQMLQAEIDEGIVATGLALSIAEDDVPEIALLRTLRAVASIVTFYRRWVRVLEEAPGFTIAAPTVRSLAKVLHRSEDDIYESLTRDDTPAPTDLERGVAVLQWLSVHVGPAHRSGLAEGIGWSFGGRAVLQERQDRIEELTKRKNIVPMKAEAIAAERVRIAAETERAVEQLRSERAQMNHEWSALQVTSLDAALTQVLVQRLTQLNDLDAKVREGRRALTMDRYRAEVAKVPPKPTTEAVKMMGAELLALAESAWRGEL